MQVQRLNGYQNQNFGTAVTIKTGNDSVARGLRALGDLLEAQAHPQFRYLHLGVLTRERDGFYKGIIGDEDHKELIQACRAMSGKGDLRSQTMKFFEETVDKEGGEPVYINRLDQILNIPIFAKCRDAIAKMIAGIKAD